MKTISYDDIALTKLFLCCFKNENDVICIYMYVSLNQKQLPNKIHV